MLFTLPVRLVTGPPGCCRPLGSISSITRSCACARTEWQWHHYRIVSIMPTDLSASRSSSSSPSSSSAASPHGGLQRPGDEREKRTPSGGKRRRRLAVIGARARWAAEWDRAYLLACAAGLMVDPLFLYAVSVSGPLMCVFLDGWFAAAVTALRCMVDALHAWNLLLRLRMACAPGEEKEEDDADEEAQRVGGAAAPARLPRSKKGGLLLDVFVILPVMQVRPCVLSAQLNV